MGSSMLSDRDLVLEIQHLFAEKLMVEVETPEADLLQTGILDSSKLVELFLLLEQQYGLTISIEKLDIEDLRSVRSIADAVARQKAA